MSIYHLHPATPVIVAEASPTASVSVSDGSDLITIHLKRDAKSWKEKKEEEEKEKRKKDWRKEDTLVIWDSAITKVSSITHTKMA